MSRTRVLVLTSFAMIAFAANSLLCRHALDHTGIDSASFTSIRVLSGALALWLIVRMRSEASRPAGNWLSASALFVYAAGFSYAYISLPAGTGALLLFGAVQTTMLGRGLWSGERLQGRQLAGLATAIGGVVSLLLPGVTDPSWEGSVLMIAAGVAWGIYSLCGKGGGDAVAISAGNFLRAAPMAALLSVITHSSLSLTGPGIAYAMLSGILASGVGYVVWYAALRGLPATTAATVQLSVPVIATAGGIVFLGEAITLRFLIISVAILGGIGLVIFNKPAVK